MLSLAVAFTGPSGSGKTTTIEKIARVLTKDYKVAIIKHDPSDKGEFDKKGKDSYRFFQTGADVAVMSSKRTTYFSHRAKELNDMINMFEEFDFLLVEGLKTLPLPRICIVRSKIDDEYFSCSDAVAVDKNLNLKELNLPSKLDVLDLKDIDNIINWIKQNAKKVRN